MSDEKKQSSKRFFRLPENIAEASDEEIDAWAVAIWAIFVGEGA